MKNEKLQLKWKSDLKKRAYFFGLEIITLLTKLPKNYAAQIIGQQLLRSATSIGANIIEAQAASSKKDFANYYFIALKSANETKYWLCLLRDSKMVKEEDIAGVLEEAIEIAKMLGSSLLTLKGRKKI